MKLVFACLTFIFALTMDGYSQKKKKNPYEGYWEQQEKQEQFDLIAKEAHLLFQNKKFEKAKVKYQEALKIIPKDQRAIAKVRDINLLLEKQRQANLEKKDTTTNQPKAEIQNEVPDTLTLFLSKPKSSEKTKRDTAPKVKSATPKNTGIPPSKNEKIATQKSVTHKKTPSKKETPKPYKNTENYRKYLATLYPQGWTEEKYKEGNKEITKRVFVNEKYGEEYLLVKHHYGAVYYFKNGSSISYATWVAETEKTPK